MHTKSLPDEQVTIPIGGIIAPSTVDWPGKCVMTIFIAGCPLNCWYCSNYKIIDPKNATPKKLAEIETLIDRAANYVDAIVLSGGEPLRQPTICKKIADHAHAKGLLVGVHTNGVYPYIEGYDAIMIDLKAVPERYPEITGATPIMVNQVLRTLEKAKKLKHTNAIEYLECRTVVFRGMNDTLSETMILAELARGADAYYLVRGRGELSRIRLYENVEYEKLEELVAKTRRTRVNVLSR